MLFAQEFNQLLDKIQLTNYKIYMINTFVAMIQPKTAQGHVDYYLFEGYIDGDYTKYTNNWDYLNDKKSIDTRPFTAFSHFTYFKS